MTQKNVLQNLRNKRINKRYKSALKSLYKIFLNKLNEYKKNNTNIIILKELNLLISNLNSIIDKSIKKNIIHLNKGNRKKIQIHKLFKNIF